MPRSSSRATILRALRKLNDQRQDAAFVRRFMEDSSDSDINSDCGFIEDFRDAQVKQAEKVISSRRYLFRKDTYRSRSEFFDWEDCISPDSKRFNDAEFRIHFRMCRESFNAIVELIRDSKYFTNHPKKRKKGPVELHLLVFLRRMGAEGTEGNSDKIANFFGIGKGTVNVYVKRVKRAILKLKDKFVVWPDAKEKDRIKCQIKLNHGFQQCIGIIDGTLIVLNQRPHLYGDSYWCRKNCYALNIQVICDDNGRVIYYYGGWPGSTHDNRAWRNCKVFLKGSEFFAESEYLLGDSAYSACKYIVQTFKKLAGSSTLTPEKEFFNTKLGGIRVKSEHCIGILKNRFPVLKRISTTIKGRTSIRRVMDLFACASILHNILLDVNDPNPEDWIKMLELEEKHKWTNDYNGGREVNITGNDDFDRREDVFNSIIEDYYN